MIRVSRLADYGTVILSYMATSPAKLFSASEISEGIKVSAPTVSKLLKSLSKANIVASVRGAQGGYRLAQSPQEISIADIVDALEGRIALTDCDGAEGQCELESHCQVRGNWQYVGEVIRQALASVSLAELRNGEFSKAVK